MIIFSMLLVAATTTELAASTKVEFAVYATFALSIIFIAIGVIWQNIQSSWQLRAAYAVCIILMMTYIAYQTIQMKQEIPVHNAKQDYKIAEKYNLQLKALNLTLKDFTTRFIVNDIEMTFVELVEEAYSARKSNQN